MIRLNLWSTRALLVRTTAGAIGARLSLRPLFSKEGETAANLGRIAPRECEVVFALSVIARSEATKQSSFLSCRAMDCFASLAMTASKSLASWLFEI
jgi:hypothetical protein